MANELGAQPPAGGQTPIQRTVELASEYVIPGGSNLIKGDIVQGGLHFVAGFIAKVAWGLPGILLVHANSLVKARTGYHIHEHLGGIQAPSNPPNNNPVL